MEVQSQTRSRVWLIALSGVGAAFAWILLSFLLGFGTASAHADEGSDTPLGGIVGDVGDAASQAVAAVTDPPVAQPVVQAAQPVVQAPQPVVQVAQPVAQAAQPVVQTVTETVAPVTAPVVAAVDEGAAAQVVSPITKTVSAVPVVGGLVSSLGADDALNELAGTADEGAGTVTGLLGRVASDRSIGASVIEDSALSGGAAAAGRQASVFSILARSSGATVTALTGAATVITAGLIAGSPAGSFSDLLSGAMPLGSAITNSGGAGLGMGAFLALGPFAAHRAWVRRNGIENDEAPPAPVLLTDVSPD